MGEVSGVSETARRVPAHLRRFVVQQDYAAYTAVDHAVWRFVLLQMYDRLTRAAHPAYARGLAQTGMSVERIPRIAEMDACLSELGWGAVCVDGFIPPRAFQEFQARSILPIAAEIRRVEHLPYTPAPDIIHEAAGHAPILPDPDYGAFLRRIGEHGMHAFASARDARMYEAIYRLSLVKELRDADPAQVRTAEQALAALVAEAAQPSEAARLARLYWWTVEYGLVGTPRAYKLYGAGLLSSLAESHFCHDPGVRKLPLGPDCVEVDYDITSPQPQLFVARDFAQLSALLDEVCAGFAFRQGGLHGLRVAREAGELATVALDSGLELTGKIAELSETGAEPALIAFDGACALGAGGRLLAAHGPGAYPSGMGALLGALADGRQLATFAADLDARGGIQPVRLELASGLRVEGRLRALAAQAGQPLALVLEHARVYRGGQQLWARLDAPLLWPGGCSVRSVRAGAEDGAYFPEADWPEVAAPAREPEDAEQRARRLLYERAAAARAQAGRAAGDELSTLHETLLREGRAEWLLRWNLLESLTRLELDPARRERLAAELWQLEHRFGGRHPIAMGLRYLGCAEPGAALKGRSASSR